MRHAVLLCALALLSQSTVALPYAAAAPQVNAPAGAAPQQRALPPQALPFHGGKNGERPPITPPLVAAQGDPKPAAARRDADAGGAEEMLARPGFELGDTSLVVYFNGTDTDSWREWRATVLDPETGQEQHSQPTSELPRCGEPRRFCRAFGASAGWVLQAGKRYSVTITVTRQDGSEVVSAPSNQAVARRTEVPPEMPASQAAGCGCPNALAASVPGQSVRGVGVNTATGAFHWSQQDFQMASFAVPFQVKRTYSSANQGSGTLGKGWAWTYDARVFPPASGETSVSVRAEDGAQVTYTRNADGSYTRPPGVRSTLTALPDNTWRLTTPGQIVYAFDAAGKLTSITNARGHGVHIGHSAAEWRITDAAGRVVVVSLNAAGLVSKITLPDGRKTQYSYEDGRLSAVQDAQGHTWSHVYAGGVLVKVVDPRGHAQITNEYAAGRVVAQSNADGARTTFEWDAGRQESKVTDPDGVVVFDGYRGNVLVYTQNGNGDAVNTRYSAALDPSLTVDARGNQRERGFDAAGNRTSAIAPEPFSFTERTTYDGRNNPTSLTNGEGHTTQFGHSPYDEVEQETAASGDKTTYQRDSRGLVTRMTDPRGKVTTFGYDQAGNMVARTAPTGARTTYSYDKTGRRLSETKPRGNVPGANPHDFTTKYGYDALDRVRTVHSPGHERPQENVYDNAGQLVRTIDPLERTTLYTYAKVLNRRISVIDPRGSVTKTGYSPAGREISRVDAEGNRATYTYDHRGRLATTVSPRGNAPGADPAQFTTRYFYDNNGNLVRTSRPYPGGGSADVDSGFDALDRRETATDEFGNQSTIRHDNTDNVTSTVDPLGNRTDIDYDANGRPSAVKTAGGGESKVVYDPAGNPLRKVSMTGGTTTWSYNDDGRVVTKTDPRGNAPGADPSAFAVRYGYDVDGNLVATTDPLGNTTRFEYDSNGRVTSSTDANNHVTRYKYDDASQLVAVTGPDGHEPTRYGYGADGSVVSRKDPLGRETEYRHDRLGQLVSVTDPLERTRTFGYDEERNLVKTVNAGRGDAKARTTIETFDSLNRRVRRQLGVDGPVYAYGFDARNRPTSIADPAGVRVQEFDKRDRLTKVTRGDQVYGYTYDRDGNVATRTWPDGTTVSSGFDKAGQLTQLTASGGRAGTTPVTYAFEYDPSGRLRKTTAPGLVTERAYDNAGRLVDMNTHGVAAYQIARDPVGNPTRIITTRGDASETSGYFYDEADRVIAAATAAPACSADNRAATRRQPGPRGSATTPSATGSARSRPGPWVPARRNTTTTTPTSSWRRRPTTRPARSPTTTRATRSGRARTRSATTWTTRSHRPPWRVARRTSVTTATRSGSRRVIARGPGTSTGTGPGSPRTRPAGTCPRRATVRSPRSTTESARTHRTGSAGSPPCCHPPAR
ncbi:RHS repeat protein [Lentzea sp. PSKA42]|uniref:RHS repeat protein n=2 Tax=Lentzea indica TaxID=2604800 RepID=A0ABX1FFD2_9PSEU|nr:RHS repeat protein [Lentzea indica]